MRMKKTGDEEAVSVPSLAAAMTRLLIPLTRYLMRTEMLCSGYQMTAAHPVKYPSMYTLYVNAYKKTIWGRPNHF